MWKVTFHEEAESEIYKAARYYEDRAADLGLAFLDEIEKTTQRISANPMTCQLVGNEIRQALVSRFPYSILFSIESSKHIRVIAVAHHKQRPGYWRERNRK